MNEYNENNQADEEFKEYLNSLLLSCESYEFISKKAKKLRADICNRDDREIFVSDKMGNSLIGTPSKKAKHLKVVLSVKKRYEEYLAISKKFEREMKELKGVSLSIVNKDISIRGVTDKVAFVNLFIEKLDKTMYFEKEFRENVKGQLEIVNIVLESMN